MSFTRPVVRKQRSCTAWSSPLADNLAAFVIMHAPQHGLISDLARDPRRFEIGIVSVIQRSAPGGGYPSGGTCGRTRRSSTLHLGLDAISGPRVKLARSGGETHSRLRGHRSCSPVAGWV